MVWPRIEPLMECLPRVRSGILPGGSSGLFPCRSVGRCGRSHPSDLFMDGRSLRDFSPLLTVCEQSIAGIAFGR